MKTSYLFIHNLLESGPVIGLFNENGLIDKIEDQKQAARPRRILNLLDKLLKKNRLKTESLRGVVVVNGPGSFTSIRLSLALANTLSYLLKIPAVGVGLDEFKTLDELIKIGQGRLRKKRELGLVLPHYGKKPNITKAKI